MDTAGIEAPCGSIAAHAQALRTAQATRADLLLDCRSPESGGSSAYPSTESCLRLAVWTKSDMAMPLGAFPGELPPIVTSALTGSGLDPLRSAVARAIRSQNSRGDLPAGTGARCRASLGSAGRALQSAALSLVQESGDELVAFDLRLAIDELGKIVGAVVTDDILDRIFRRFCIGK